MLIKENAPVVSVVVPVYGTEKYLVRCLESILNQTYFNIELCVVNDASPDKALDIINKYVKFDGRIKLVNNETNLGLFRARVEGAKACTGKYIMFIDSDDYIGVDYVRSLVFAAEKDEADIAKAQFVMEEDSDEHRQYIYSYINHRPRLKLYGEDITKKYFEQQGLDFSWHVVWGKIYSMDLWKKCEPYFTGINEHLIMTEDIVFSTVLFFYAQKYVEIDCDTYFYVQRKSASTGITMEYSKFQKNISDLRTSFSFRENFLRKNNVYERYEEDHLKWKELYARSWKNTILVAGFKGEEANSLEKQLHNALGIEKLTKLNNDDNYFYSQIIDWSNLEENVKNTLMDYQYISFDIFDTLILRPFWEPTDMFRLLELKYKELNPKAIADFSRIRREAEQEVREEIVGLGKEEITIDDIYDKIVADYGIEKKYSEILKQCEKDLELQFCKRRNFGYELYELAKFLGKQIIIVTDMYLDRKIIEEILDRNGYTGYKELYLSCECQKTKASGNMYVYIKNQYPPTQILHIGDNYYSDCEMAQKHHIRCVHFPKTTEIFRGDLIHAGYYAGNSYNNMIRPHGALFDNKVSMEFWGIRCMLAVIANKFFDNPFQSFSKEADFNSNLYYISYYTLGMHLFGMAMDLLKRNRNCKTIHFVARDGYECKEVYDILKNYIDDVPQSNYLYLSRKALLPLAFNNASDVHFIKENISYDSVDLKTPREILKQFIGVDCDNEIESFLDRNGYQLDNCFKNMKSFDNFIRIIGSNETIFKKNVIEKEKIRKKLNEIIKEDDILFDIGYNGTAQKILTNLLGRPVNAYYAYINKDRPQVNQQELGCNVQTFYDRTPCISGAIREMMFSKGEPSCIGYIVENDHLSPVFEQDKLSYIEKMIYGIINIGVREFAEDICNIFSNYLNELTYRNYDISLPFEFLLQRASNKDCEIFSSCYFEDDIFFGKERIPLTTWWLDYRDRQESKNFQIIYDHSNREEGTKGFIKKICKIVKSLNRLTKSDKEKLENEH